jgi:GH25 family lysozyme M1 (1,4-beta-N-acetylmuramidase)
MADIAPRIRSVPTYATNLVASQLLPQVGTRGRAHGIDISHWEEWFKAEQATVEIDFAIAKITEGKWWVDPEFDQLWYGVRQIPIRGLYHYQRSGQSWKEQADFFLTNASKYDVQIYALDIEKINNTLDGTFFSDVRRIIDYWRAQAPGKKVMMYTNYDLYQYYLPIFMYNLYGQEGRDWLAQVPLWYAQYYTISSPDKDPKMPSVRSDWNIWQYSEAGDPKLYGIGGWVDVNVFNGTPEEMFKWAGLSDVGNDPIPPVVEPEPEPEQPTTGDNMRTGIVSTKLRKVMVVRDAPSVHGNEIARLAPGTVIYAQPSYLNETEAGKGEWTQLVDPDTYAGGWITDKYANSAGLLLNRVENWTEVSVDTDEPADPPTNPEPPTQTEYVQLDGLTYVDGDKTFRKDGPIVLYLVP